MSVSLRENITAVIETCFSETKEEIQDTAINRILELIRADRETEPQMGDAKPIPLSNRVTHIKDEPQTDCPWK